MNAHRIRIIYIVLLAAVSCLVQSCISLKSDYQPTSYYRLQQPSTSIQTADTLPGTLYIRTFTTNEEYNNDHLLYYTDDVRQVDYYVYHRWISEMPDLVTDFIANRYIEKNVFRTGVVQSSSTLIPNYILEGKVLEMIADNSAEPGSVLIRVQISLINVEPMQVDRPVILQRVYEASARRTNTNASSIPAAYSEALADITDRMLVDITNAIRYHNANTPKGATVQLEEE